MPGGYLTTHVLDTARGMPAAGMMIDLFRFDGSQRFHIGYKVTNDDGRTDGPILPKEEFKAGTYELEFRVGAYLKATGQEFPEPFFLDVVPIRFGMSDPMAHYHVPLLVSPFGYSTYRGS